MGFHRQRTTWLWRNPDNVTHRQLLSIEQIWPRSTALTWSRWGCRRLADNVWLLARDNNNNLAKYWSSDASATITTSSSWLRPNHTGPCGPWPTLTPTLQWDPTSCEPRLPVLRYYVSFGASAARYLGLPFSAWCRVWCYCGWTIATQYWPSFHYTLAH